MVNGSMLLEPDCVETIPVEPTLAARARSDGGALAEIDEALAALGICLDPDATFELDRQSFDQDAFDLRPLRPIPSG